MLKYGSQATSGTDGGRRVSFSPAVTPAAPPSKPKHKPTAPNPSFKRFIGNEGIQAGGRGNKFLSGLEWSTDINAVLQAVSGVGDVFVSPVTKLPALLRAQRTHDAGGAAQQHRAGGDLHAHRDQRTRADEALFADLRAIENGGAHADEHFVSDRAGVNDRAVADRHVIADDTREIVREMKDRIVLDIRVVTDGNAVD